MSNNGRLIQQYVTVEWGSTNLSYMDDGEGGKEILAQEISFSLEEEGFAPSCEFSITPNPLGFATFSALKSGSISEPIKITVGYPNGSSFTQTFVYSGMNLTTGHSPKISVSAVSVLKGAMTDNRVSYTMEEPMMLKDLPEFLKAKAGEGAGLVNFVWKGTAEEYASSVEYQENQIDRTPYSILTDAMRVHGIEVQPGDSAFDGTIVLSRSPGFEGEQESDPPEVVSGAPSPEAGKKSVYIIGPGLMENLTRKQTFNMGQSNPKGGASKSKTSSYEQDQKEVQTGPPAGVTQIAAAASENTTGGTTGSSQIPSTMSKTPEATGGDAKKGRQAATEDITTELSFDCLMVPYLVGIKPRDFCAIPSLGGPGNYVEDWSIKSTRYSQKPTGEIRVSVSAVRPFTGDDNLLDGSTLAAVQATASTLTTPAKWNKFYWIEGDDPDYPLAG